jgi:hypothetical protein
VQYDPNILRAVAKAHLEAQDPLRRYVPYPLSVKQREFYENDEYEVAYLGSAGSGKSAAALAAALRYVNVPGYSALILRRTYADLTRQGALIDLSHQWLRNKADVTWRESAHTWTWDNGASIAFGHLADSSAHYSYQGAQLQCIVFDEICQIPPDQFIYLHSRVRGLNSSATPLRVRVTANPGGEFHKFYKRRYFDDNAGDKVVVRASFKDNPGLDYVSYDRSLQNLDPIARAQLRDGDWEIEDASGKIYYSFSDANVADALPATDAAAPWVYSCGIDFGKNDPTAFVVTAQRRYDPCIYVVHAEKHSDLTASQVAEIWRRLDAQFGLTTTVGDPASAQFVDTLRREHWLPLMAAKKTDKLGNMSLLNGELANFRVVFLPRSEPLVTELRELRWKNDAKREEHSACANHCADALLYVWRAVRDGVAYENRERIPRAGDPGYDDWITERALERMRNKWAEERNTESILFGGLVGDSW